MSSPVADPSTSEGATSIAQLVTELSHVMRTAVGEIGFITASTEMLAINARIESVRAGQSGAAFGVVASEIHGLSGKTTNVAATMVGRTQQLIDRIGSSVRGTRLSDLALMNIDLVDRNLYERTCDVRWWATDSSLVDALESRSPKAYEHASKRMGIILNAYTVYHDLVLTDLSGRIIANGRPDSFNSCGASAADTGWFRQAIASRSGDEFGFATAHRSPLVGNKSVLGYSCGVRRGGDARGPLLGVLGVLFNWEAFAQTIVNSVPLAEDERDATRVYLCDEEGTLLADSWGKQLDETIRLPDQKALFAEGKNFAMREIHGKQYCVAHARAPGFETYSTGWHSVLLQPVS